MAPVFAAGPSSSSWRAAAVMMVVMAAVVGLAGADFAADKAECADKLMGLATCLTYVQATATARAPTPDCCAGFKAVLAASKKCLCVLVKDRDEPALGIKFNVTRSMDLPSACSLVGATFSDCPQILKMSPDSKEAEIFKEYAREHESKNGTAAAAAGGGGAGGKSMGMAAAAAAAAPAPTGGAGEGRVQRGTVLVGVVTALLAAAVIGV